MSTPETCPKCGGELIDGTCLFDGPLTEILATMNRRAAPPENVAPSIEHPPQKVHQGWTGHDRDLGAKKRAERAAEADAVEERSKLPGRLLAAFGTVLSLALIGGVAFLWNSGALETEKPSGTFGGASLPRALPKAASPARADLALLARALDEVALEAENRLVGDPDAPRDVIERFLSRLDGLHGTQRALEPQLTREESRILMALAQAERDMTAWLKSLLGPAPELAGTRLQNARENVGRALVLLRGGSLDDAVKVYAEKAAAAKALMEGNDER